MRDCFGVRSRTNRRKLQGRSTISFAATHALQIALEAASRISADTKATLPDIPWAEMNGMRNRLVHAYFDTDLDILWRTITVAVPPMLATLRRFVSDA